MFHVNWRKVILIIILIAVVVTIATVIVKKIRNKNKDNFRATDIDVESYQSYEPYVATSETSENPDVLKGFVDSYVAAELGISPKDLYA